MYRIPILCLVFMALLGSRTAWASIQVDPTSRPSGQEADADQEDVEEDDDKQQDEGATQEEREKQRNLRLDLTVPEHDKDSLQVDKKTGVVWSWLHRGPATRPNLQIGDQIRCHLTLWDKKDGTELESTRRREGRSPSPVVVDTGAFVRGLNVVMPHLRPGDKVRVDIPAAMGFGAKGMRERIKPNTDLIYALQVMRVEGHVDIPEFPTWDDSKASKLEEGSAYIILKDGEGEMAGDKAAIAFDYVFWDESGNIIDCSLFDNKAPVGGQVGRFGREYLDKVGQIARRNGAYFVRLPSKLIFRKEAPAHVDTSSEYLYFWLKPRELVPFHHHADAKMQKDPNGLEYVILKPGSEDKIQPEDRVHIHYAHWDLKTGNLFDASYTRGISNNFRQVGLIPGMRQALAKIGPGAEIRVRIPAKLAWGEAGRAGVGANADILMHLELFPEALPTKYPRRLLEKERMKKERQEKKQLKQAEKAKAEAARDEKAPEEK